MINPDASSAQDGDIFADIVSVTSLKQIYRSLVFDRSATPIAGGATAYAVYQIQAFIYLRHLHSFFSQIPLLKGVFFRLTLNLNQPIVTVSAANAGGAGDGKMTISEIISPLGGVSPIMIASQDNYITSINGGATEDDWGLNTDLTGAVAPGTASTMRVTLNVGNTIIDSTQKQRIPSFGSSSLNTSVFLHVPLFTFNPAFESAYLSRPTKTIVYSDLYQYTTTTVTAGQQFNFLITNGISNIKSVLVLPMEAKIPNTSYPPFWSPFDSCGGGSCAPMSGSAVSNFNVVIAGQNMIYNQVTRAYDEFNNQLYGVNAVNGGLTDGLTSGLIDYWKWLQLYGYFYVNCARQLPIDEAVPKSCSIQGTNLSELDLQFYVFIEYGVQVNVDVLTGARV
jgi:hypothetical protein